MPTFIHVFILTQDDGQIQRFSCIIGGDVGAQIVTDQTMARIFRGCGKLNNNNNLYLSIF